MSRALRVGYISDCDPRHPWGWSGTHSCMFRSLAARGLEVEHVGKTLLPRWPRLRRLAGRLGWNWGQEDGTDETARVRRRAAALQAELAERRYDVLFAPVSSGLIPFLETDVPIVYLSDATFRLLRTSYAETAALTDLQAVRRDDLEARALARAERVVFPSAWAAASAVQDYGCDPDRTHVVPLGANLDAVPARSEVLPKSVDGVCRLLFIGRDWKRKGGDVAVDTVRWLRAMGIPCELTIVGSKAPASAADVAPRVYANLDKRRRRHRRTLRRLLSESHFLLLPTRAECFGVVCCEANAFALPVLATDVGGVPVEEGRNGCRLPLAASGWDFAVRIGRILYEPGRYAELAATARETYEKRLSWGAWAEVMESVLREAVAGRQPERRVA